MITKEEYEKYEEVRRSGLTNMFDITRVIELSDYDLDKEKIMEIMKTYGDLIKKYPGVRK